MSSEEVKQLDKMFLPYEHPTNKMKLFHNKETGEAVLIIYNRSIGVLKLRDLLTLTPEALSDFIGYFKTRSYDELRSIMRVFRSELITNMSVVESMTEPMQVYNQATMKIEQLIHKHND